MCHRRGRARTRGRASVLGLNVARGGRLVGRDRADSRNRRVTRARTRTLGPRIHARWTSPRARRTSSSLDPSSTKSSSASRYLHWLRSPAPVLSGRLSMSRHLSLRSARRPAVRRRPNPGPHSTHSGAEDVPQAVPAVDGTAFAASRAPFPARSSDGKPARGQVGRTTWLDCGSSADFGTHPGHITDLALPQAIRNTPLCRQNADAGGGTRTPDTRIMIPLL